MRMLDGFTSASPQELVHRKGGREKGREIEWEGGREGDRKEGRGSM